MDLHNWQLCLPVVKVSSEENSGSRSETRTRLNKSLRSHVYTEAFNNVRSKNQTFYLYELGCEVLRKLLNIRPHATSPSMHTHNILDRLGKQQRPDLPLTKPDLQAFYLLTQTLIFLTQLLVRLARVLVSVAFEIWRPSIVSISHVSQETHPYTIYLPAMLSEAKHS